MIGKELKLERLKRLREKLKAPPPSNIYRVWLVVGGERTCFGHMQIRPGHYSVRHGHDGDGRQLGLEIEGFEGS